MSRKFRKIAIVGLLLIEVTGNPVMRQTMLNLIVSLLVTIVAILLLLKKVHINNAWIVIAFVLLFLSAHESGLATNGESEYSMLFSHAAKIKVHDKLYMVTYSEINNSFRHAYYYNVYHKQDYVYHRLNNQVFEVMATDRDVKQTPLWIFRHLVTKNKEKLWINAAVPSGRGGYELDTAQTWKDVMP